MTKFGSSRLEICVIGIKEQIEKLLDNGFDTILLVDSVTKETVELEITDLFIDETIIFSDNDSEDIRIA